MNNTSNGLVNMAEDKGETLINTEWRLADMVDAIAAEIDRAEDTLALKSYARGMSFAIKQLSLDLQVAVRRDSDGNIKFRTAEPNATGSTTLKLDFAQILQNQLSANRRKLDGDVDPRPLDALGLTSEEIRRLNAISIYSSDDLRGYTQTAAMIGEVSRKTSIKDTRLRQVLGLPYIEALKPGGGLPGSTILLEGGNFGAVQPSQASVYFQGVAVSILAWSNARIQVKIPANATGSGVIFLVINDQISNTIDWQVLTIDLIVKDITIAPSNPKANEEITLTASLANQGSGEASAFTVQWSIDGQKQTPQPHGVLPPNQASQESSLVRKIRLTAGEHRLSFTADPDQKLADVDRVNSTFTKTITVAAVPNLIVRDITIAPSNPKANEEITLTASLANQGSGEASAFTVQWSIDGQKQTPQPHGVLPPNQASQESSLVRKIRLTAGEHRLSFTADPDQKLADIDRANSTFTKTITVAAAQTSVNLGDYSIIDSLDPFTSQQPWELRQDVLNLVYRGLMRFDPNNGELLPDLSHRSQVEYSIESYRARRYELRQDVRFHDGSALTAQDVVFSYRRAKESSSWSQLLSGIGVSTPDSYNVVISWSLKNLVPLSPEIFTLPIVPAKVYESDPKRFITNPVGCGPFIAELNQSGKPAIVQLRAFEQYYLGKPRLQNLSIALQPDINVLIEQLVAGELNAIKLPDSQDVELAKKLKSLEDKYQIIRHSTARGRGVVHVQDRALRERLPNKYETNWNAHLWYI
jgi:peptide/nickel transport system substrate-binding protein